MSIELFPHNREACFALEKLLDKEKRAAVVHPTGTGKSMIAFRLAQEHSYQRFLWLSLSEYIVKTQLENVRKTDPTADFSHIQFMTYARLMVLDPETLAQLKPDYIILDEFHRCGAEMWGAGVERLLTLHDQARLIGLSATKIRYLDHQRDMVEELFDGYIASEMTLGEAVVRGILPLPRYVTTVYQYQRILEKYVQRIQVMRSKRQRQLSEKYLQTLRRAMENADGLDVVFQKHLTDRTGRYLVFCASVSHMKEMHEHVSEWFGGIDPQAHSYFVYADNPESLQAYAEFRQDDSDHLKLLFCINMLNEGIHVEGVSGVILFRPTVSPIIYKQQIGRALTAGKTAQPLILDVVNNIESLYSIGFIQQEMDEAIIRLRTNGQGELIVQERFKVIDQVQDCRRLFEQLEESLYIDWDEYFLAAEAYLKEKGDLLIPQRYVTDDGKCLGAWLNTQQCIYNGTKRGKLTQVQIDRLDELGIVWGIQKDLTWEIYYRAAESYYQEHGHLAIPQQYVSQDGRRLGIWICNIRTRYAPLQGQDLETFPLQEQERFKRLEQIGMIWNFPDARWEAHFEAAREYAQQYGNLQIPIKYKTSDGLSLGTWITNQRRKYSGTATVRLTTTQIERLESIGMVWNVQETNWMRHYAAAANYYKAYGNLDMRKDYVTPDGYALGLWLVNQRAIRKKNKGTPKAMSQERVRLLDKLGIRW